MKNNKLKILTITTALLLGGNAMATENTWKEKSKDAWIDGKVETTILFNSELNNFDINTDVKNGNVILTGKVENSVDKKLAEELVTGIDGVKDVDNQLTIVNENMEDESNWGLVDAKIATVVKTKFLFDSDIHGTDIDVDVENGVVTLSGNVKSDAEEDLVVTTAENVSDVKEVVNKLQVM
tara:strand:- start:32393 stop:32935 length:543 start_codon:yes stop_codon:yes gene_type:complete